MSTRKGNAKQSNVMVKATSNEEALVHLSSTALQRLPKPRSGFEPWAMDLIALAKRMPRLQAEAFDGDALIAELQIPRALQAEISETAKKLDMLRETQLKHNSHVWTEVLGIYERAKTEAKTNPDVEYAIARFEEFMKHGKRKPAIAPKPAAPVTP